MKVKAIVATLATLGLAWTGASWYTGQQVESWYRAETDKANALLKEAGFPADISLAVASYERGIFSSTVHYALRLPELCGVPKEVVFIDTLSHGPFPLAQLKQGKLQPALFASHGVLQNDAGTAPLFAAAQGEPLTTTATASFSHDIRAQVVVAPLSIKTGSENITMAGARIDILSLNEGKSINGTGTIDSLEIASTDGAMQGKSKAEGISFAFDTARHGESTLFLGQNDVGVKSMKVSVNGAAVLSVADLAEVTVTSEKDQKLSVRHTLNVGSWDIMGVGMPVVSSAFEVNSLNISAMKPLSKLYYSWMFQAMCSANSADDSVPELSAEQQKTLNTALHTLLADKPSFTWSPLEFKNQDGEIRFDMAAVLSKADGLSATATSQELLANSVQSFNAKLVMSKPLLIGIGYEAVKKINLMAIDEATLKNEVTQQVERLSKQALATGFFSLDNDKLSSTLNYDQGVLNINGQTMPPGFLGSMLPAIAEQAEGVLF